MPDRLIISSNLASSRKVRLSKWLPTGGNGGHCVRPIPVVRLTKGRRKPQAYPATPLIGWSVRAMTEIEGIPWMHKQLVSRAIKAFGTRRSCQPRPLDHGRTIQSGWITDQRSEQTEKMDSLVRAARERDQTTAAGASGELAARAKAAHKTASINT